MADSEEFRLKRLKHDQHLSRVFDEVMGLGDFAESSRGSATSSKSDGQEETKGVDKTSEQGEHLQVEEDSGASKQEGKTEEGMGDSSIPRISSTSSDQPHLLTMGTKEGGSAAGRSGGAALDNALDGLEEDEDWNFSLPMGNLEDSHKREAESKDDQAGVDKNGSQSDSLVQPREEEEEEEDEEEGEHEHEKDGSSQSSNTSHSSQDHTPDNSQDDGALNPAEETEDSQDGERSEAAPVEESNPPISPVNIKDEPIDEGYDAALLPQSSIKQIKEELEHQEEELRISSVYSVGGANTFAAPTMPAPVQAPPQATIFIPSRGAVLQAMAPFPVRPPPPVQIHNSIPALTSVPPRPPPPPVPGSVRCSGCSKVLLKGQTAFQRKGSTQLFCSTVCLTGHLPPASKNRSCFQCNREIIQPRDMITIPTEDNNYMHFCGQFCLSVFRHKKKQTDKFPDKWVEKRPERKPEKLPEKAAERQPEKPVCSVCKVSNRLIEHEVTHQGRLHRLCSNACFVTWRKMRQLAMNCCEGCGLYCNSNSGSCQTLVIDRSQLNFCSPTCIGTYKQTCRKMIECANCHKMALVSTTIMERDQKGKVQLYCSPACVELSRPAQHILSGAAFPCCQCKVSAVPQYHLAMVDGTIRNFCSLDCVSGFRKSSHISQPDLINGNSTLREYSPRDPHKPGSSAGASSVPPIPQDYSSSVPYQSHHPSHTSVPPLVSPYPGMSSPSVPGQVQAKALAGQPQKLAEGRPIDTSKLTCHQCNRQFNIKPVLFSHQSRISMFCSRSCCDQYKTLKNITAVCEYCKQEKILFDTISYNQQDLIFCSDNCKVLFKHELTSRNKDHPWHPCTYCSGASQKMLHSHYGGRMEEFCRPHCMSQYTVLYYGMGRCDGCRKQGYMTEKLQCLGSVRNFCNLPCLLQYCSLHFEMSQHTSSNGTGTTPQTPYAPAQPNHSSKMNPVIADVVSLANGSATQPSDTALTGALPTSVDGKNLDHASTQTDAVRPGPRRRQMKNKSVLCRPFTMDQESSCQLSEPSPELAAVSISAPNLLDSTLQPGRSSADASTSPPPSPKPHRETQQCSGVPSRLTGRHFLGKRDADSDCKVCSQRKRKRVEDEEKQQQEEEKKKKKIEENIETGTETGEAKEAEGGVSSHCENDGARKKEEHCDMKDAEQKSVTLRKQTSYYCKTCSGEPSLCPVPCFELFHTRLIYRTAPELEAQASFSVNLSTQQEKVKVLLVPVPVPVFIPVPMNMYSQHAPVPLTMPLPIPVPIVVPPQKKDTRDAGVQSEPLAVREEKPKVEPFSRADQSSPHSGDRKPDMIARIVHSGDMKQDVVTRSPQSDNLKTDLITRSPESDDMKTDMITHSPHSDDMKTDMITRSFHSDKMKLEVVPCIPHSDDVKTDMIAHSSQSDDMNTDMITRSPDSGGMKIDTMTRNPQSDDMKTDVVTCISHGGHMKQEVVTHSPHGGDMKTDVVTRSPHGGDMKTDLVNRSPHRGDMKTDLVTRSPHDGDMKTDVVTRSPHGGDMKTDVVTRSPHGGDMKTDLVNRSPHRGDMKTDLVTHSPHDGDMKTDVVTRSPHGGDMKTDVVTRSPHGGDMKTDLVTRSPHDGDMKTDVVTRSPHDGDMKTDVVTRSPHGGDMKPDVVTPMLPEHEETQKAVQAELPPPASPEKNSESADPCKSMQAETSTTLSDQPTTSIGQPPSPMMDLETDFPSVSLDKKPSAPQRGVKRPREGFSGRKRGRRRIAPPDSSAAVTPDASKVNHLYGVKAWKSWVQHRAKQVGEVDVKEDVLQCDVAELSFALSHFIKEVRRPNGETYSPDSIFYLCLGIQQYLFMGGRIENIFTDERYSQFVNELTRMLQLWKPKLLPTGGVVSSRVVESYLWECKQLGAYSPIVLLNTLLFFCTKSFHFTTLAQHQTLCFNRITLCSKPCTRAGKVHYLRFHRGSAATPRETERLRKKQAEEEGDVEILESVTNLLHCPVRLYEFYLSRCPDSVRQRTDLFYLQPERNVHTHSPHWYTAQPLEDSTLQSMLTRILAVREVHPEQEAEQRQSSATPDDESLP